MHSCLFVHRNGHLALSVSLAIAALTLSAHAQGASRAYVSGDTTVFAGPSIDNQAITIWPNGAIWCLSTAACPIILGAKELGGRPKDG